MAWAMSTLYSTVTSYVLASSVSYWVPQCMIVNTIGVSNSLVCKLISVHNHIIFVLSVFFAAGLTYCPCQPPSSNMVALWLSSVRQNEIPWMIMPSNAKLSSYSLSADNMTNNSWAILLLYRIPKTMHRIPFVQELNMTSVWNVIASHTIDTSN